MAARKEISPELMAEARRLYERTLSPVDDIAAMLGLCRTAFYKRVKEWKWTLRRAGGAQFEFARALTTAVAAERAQTQDDGEGAVPVHDAASVGTPAIDRTALAARLLELVGTEMNAIDTLLKSVGPAGPGEMDRSSRAVAALGRSLREIHALLNPPREASENDIDEAADDSVPLDIDEFRSELARRINEFVDARRSRAGGAGDPSVGRDDAEEA